MPEAKQADLSKNDLDTLRTAAAAKAFLDSGFGKFYMKLLREALEAKRLEYEKPVEVAANLDGVGQVLRAESAKGAIMGIRLSLSLLDGMVSAGDALRTTKGLTTAPGDEE